MKSIILIILIFLSNNFYAASPQNSELNFDGKFNSSNICKNPPISIKLSVKNTGTKILKVLKADLSYPDFFKFKGEINQIQIKENIKPGEEIVFEWNFNYPDNTYKRINLKAQVLAYDENMKLLGKEYSQEVFLTQGRDVPQNQEKINIIRFAEVIAQFVVSGEIIKLFTDELDEINFFIEKLNTATEIEAFIAGNKTIPPALSLELNERFKLILKNIEEREKKLNELLKKYQYIN